MAQIRLTKTMRETILQKIMNDLPQIDYYVQEKDLITSWIKSTIPPEITKLIGTPLEVYLNKEQKNFYLQEISSRYSVCVLGASSETLSIPDWLRTKLLALKVAREEQRSTYRQLLDKVESTLAAYTTVDKLRTDCPQFDKYLPNEAAINHPITVITSPIPALQAAGWPKGKP